MSSAAQTARHTHHRIPLRTYVDYRLGRDEPWWRQSLNVLVRPLTAASFAGFWRSWNPVWGYYLSYWFYKPARRVLPHLAAVMVTFTASGLAHNLLATLVSHRFNPFVTGLFMLYGAVTVVSEAGHMDLSRLPEAVRVVINLAYLIGCYELVSPLLPA
jgi:MBOAT, membrane-bound O-acyltransferase family